MKLSAFSVVDHDPLHDSAGRNRYAELLSLARACDGAGLHAVWIAEHHFHSGGVCPSPAVALAALGQVTSQVRLGSLVSVLPFHNPLEVAEEYALVDHLTNGRLNLGVGSGYIPLEFQGFGLDPVEKRDRFDRSLATILRAWDGEGVEVKGPNAGVTVRLNIRPRQRPRPPVWVAVQRKEAIPYVARRGLNLALIPYATVQDLAELREEIAEFRSALPTGQTAQVAAAVHVYAGDRTMEGREALHRYLESRLKTQSTFYQAKVEKQPDAALPETLEAASLALIGSAQDVAQKLRAYQEAGVDELLGIFDFGGIPKELSEESVRGLAKELRREGMG